MSNKTQKVENTSTQQLDPRMASYLFGSDSNGQMSNYVQKDMPGLFSTAMDLYSKGPAQYYDGSTYAGLNDVQKSAIGDATDYLKSSDANAAGDAAIKAGNSVLDSAYKLPSSPLDTRSQFLGGDYSGALSKALSGEVDMSAYNPMADAITSRVNRNFNESVLPSIRNNSIANGTLGGSRQGIAEGLAASRMNEDLAGSLSNLYGNAYTQAQGARNAIAPAMANLALNQQGQDRTYGLASANYGLQANQQQNNALGQGVGLLTQGASQPMSNYQSLIGLGGLLQQEDQNQINADKARWDYGQNADWQNLNNISGLLTGNATLGATNAVTGSQFYNPTMQWMGALGGFINNVGGAAGKAASSASGG